MRIRLLDAFRDPGRRRRARMATQVFADAREREAAERVYLFIERIAGVRPADVDLDAEIAPLLVGPRPSWFWDRREQVLSLHTTRRIHAFENLRTGSVRHLIHHLCVCRTCRAAPHRRSEP